MRVLNYSTFGVMLNNGAVVATIGGASGSLAFDTYPTTSLEAGQAVVLQGVLILQRLPPPFAEVDVCVRFVAENACGQSKAWDNTRGNCARVRGL
jgi:hypothetical protein